MKTFEAFYRTNDPKYKNIKKKGQAWYKEYQAELNRLAPDATRNIDWDTATHLMNQGIPPKEAAKRFAEIFLNR
jgi:hypothetical protein